MVEPATGASACPTDEELATEYRRTGNRNALDVLIRRYSPRLRRMVITLMGPDESTVLDAEQEVFVALIRKLGQFQGRSAFGTFFYRLARNRILDLMRSRARYRQRIGELAEPERSVARTKGPEQIAIDAERTSLLRLAMSRLSPDDRMLLYLKDGEQNGIADLIELTGLPAGTVKSRLARSRAKVAVALEDLGYEH